jgi:malate dehydrogenase (oxaloacetate-decarboxylating)(NADP+)
MFLAAACTPARQTTKSDLDQSSLYPLPASIRDVSAHIAAAVAEVAFDGGSYRAVDRANLPPDVRSQVYDPRYPRYA